MKFTQEAISQLIPMGEKVVYRDPSKPNLELRLYKNGTRKFYYRSRNKAYQKDIPLGEHLAQVMPIYDALFNIRHLPPTPILEPQVINLFRDNATLHTLKQRFIRDHVKQNLTEDTVTIYSTYINRLIVYLEDNESHLSTHICSLQDAQDSIRDYIDSIAKYTPTTANRMASCFSKMFNFGIDKRIVTHNPASGIPRCKEKPRRFFATDDQLSAYFEAWHQSKCQPMVLDALRLIMLTGMRTGELRAITRDMVDFSSRKLVLPGEITKNGMSHMIVLSQSSFDILKKWCQGLSGACTVFSMGKYTLHQVCTRMSHRASQRATPHDLRKLFATELARLGTKDSVIESMLNHTSSSNITKKHYNFYQYEAEKRYASEKLAQKYRALGL